MNRTAPETSNGARSLPATAHDDDYMGGYAHPGYAASLVEVGDPRQLISSEGWILERSIPRSSARDAMGCYPLFVCRDWSLLKDDLKAIGQDLVSLVVVTDPFGPYTEENLQASFSDLVLPYKQHFVVDLQHDLESFVHSNHQRNARKALSEITVERATNPAAFLNEWDGLYAGLIERHGIKGIACFSRESFAKSLRVPGMELFRAIHLGQTIGITLWYVSGDRGYYHLAAYNETGYALRASFALFWQALKHFATAGVRRIGLGAGAGVDNDTSDGLTRFKKGWSNDMCRTFLCGKIFDPDKYRKLSDAKGIISSDYFPAYRTGEFV